MNTTHEVTAESGFYTLKPDLDEAQQRLEAFWAGSSLGRPALYVTVRNADALHEPFDGPTVPTERDLLPAWHVHIVRHHLRERLFLGEAMPFAPICVGSNLVLPALLCEANYHYEGGTVWIHPRDNLWERTPPVFDVSHPVIRAVDESLRAVAQEVGPAGYVNPPAMLDPMITLSLMGGNDLCLDVIEEPEPVHLWREALSELYIRCSAHFQEVLLEQDQGRHASSWLHLVAPGSFDAVQCDFAVMLSPTMFDEFVRSDLQRATEHLDYSLYHLDGTSQLRFLDQLQTLPRLNGIQWNPEPEAQGVMKWIDVFKDIRRRGWVLHFNSWEIQSVDEAAALIREIGPDGVSIALPEFNSQQEAEIAIKTMEQAAANYRSGTVVVPSLPQDNFSTDS